MVRFHFEVSFNLYTMKLENMLFKVVIVGGRQTSC